MSTPAFVHSDVWDSRICPLICAIQPYPHCELLKRYFFKRCQKRFRILYLYVPASTFFYDCNIGSLSFEASIKSKIIATSFYRCKPNLTIEGTVLKTIKYIKVYNYKQCISLIKSLKYKYVLKQYPEFKQL